MVFPSRFESPSSPRRAGHLRALFLSEKREFALHHKFQFRRRLKTAKSASSTHPRPTTPKYSQSRIRSGQLLALCTVLNALSAFAPPQTSAYPRSPQTSRPHSPVAEPLHTREVCTSRTHIPPDPQHLRLAPAPGPRKAVVESRSRTPQTPCAPFLNS